MHPNDVWSVIGTNCAECSIPFYFSKCRHLQRGLIKHKSSDSLLCIRTAMPEDADTEIHEVVMRDAGALRHASIVYAVIRAAICRGNFRSRFRIQSDPGDSPSFPTMAHTSAPQTRSHYTAAKHRSPYRRPRDAVRGGMHRTEIPLLG